MDKDDRVRIAEQLLEVVEELLEPDRDFMRFVDEHPELEELVYVEDELREEVEKAEIEAQLDADSRKWHYRLGWWFVDWLDERLARPPRDDAA